VRHKFINIPQLTVASNIAFSTAKRDGESEIFEFRQIEGSITNA
jgi:hypothetical protein